MAHRRKRQQRYFRVQNASERQQIPPARAEDVTFCAYFGPQGEFCAETADLEKVFSVTGAGLPELAWMACPLHQEDVRQRANAFQRRLLHAPQSLTFTYHGTVAQVQMIPTEEETGQE